MIRTVRPIAVTSVLLLMLANSVSGQWNLEGWKEGVYQTHADFMVGRASLQGPFQFRPATALGIEEHFKLTDIFQRADLRNAWAIYQDSSIYLNIERLGMGEGHVRIPEPDVYTYFIGVSRQNIEERNRNYSNLAMAGGLMGVAAGAVVNGVSRPHQIDYLLNLETGQITEITERNMFRILEPYERLYNAYLMDSERSHFSIILMYIDLLNDEAKYGRH